MELSDAVKALKNVGWDGLLTGGVGEKFAVLIDGEAVVGEVVFVQDKANDDEYDERDLAVVVKIGDQLFKKSGYAQVGSHCYGDYENSWGSLTEVRETERIVIEYAPV